MTGAARFDFSGRPVIRDLMQRAEALSGITCGQLGGWSTAQDICMVRYAVVHVATARGRTARQIGQVMNRNEATIYVARKRAKQLLAGSEMFRNFVEELEVLP